MNCRKWLLVFVIIVHAATAYCLEASVNYAVFHRHSLDGKDSVFLEVYWQIDPVSLHYHKNENGELYTNIQTLVTITSDTGLVKRDRYVLATTPAKPGQAAQQNLYQFHKYYVPAGKLELRVDLGENEFLQQNFQFSKTINTLDTAKSAHFGTVQLLDTFLTSAPPSIFFKNGYTQLPRVIPFYDEGQRTLHFSSELYSTLREGPPLIQHFYISKGIGDYPIIRLQAFDTIRTVNAFNAGLHTFDLSTLATGNYYLNAQLIDGHNTIIDTQTVFFQMINKQPLEVKLTAKDSANEAKQATNFLDLSKTFVSKFNTKQIMAILKMIRPTAEPNEVTAIDNFFKRPDDMYMHYFVYNFFSKQNKAHPEDAWIAFADQIREINRDFNSGNKMGYETDRGRIYLQYGKPNERVRVPNESGAVPYEIWRYDVMATKQNQIGTFLFYQPGFSISEFILLTSTVSGEPYNPNWRSMLFVNGKSGSTNSRAEQYMEGK